MTFGIPSNAPERICRRIETLHECACNDANINRDDVLVTAGYDDEAESWTIELENAPSIGTMD